MNPLSHFDCCGGVLLLLILSPYRVSLLLLSVLVTAEGL